MASIGNHFIPNKRTLISDEKTVFVGKNYRITVLSERLLRLEFSKDGLFNDKKTMLVNNRSFNSPPFKVEEDEKYLVITTKYFTMQYIKGKPFLGPKYAPDSNLKVLLNNTDKVWYYNHPEARNFKTTGVSLDDFKNDKIRIAKGLYSTDGFATIDDSFNLILDDEGYVLKNTSENIDLYLFMYKRDFGLCLKDYFTLTGYPPLIPRYALGIWWNKEQIYSFNDMQDLVKTFNKYQIPLSVVLLSEFWHIKDEIDYNKYRSGYTFNKTLFPNVPEFTKYMHDRGVHIGLHMDPSEGIRKEEDCFNAFSEKLESKNGVIPFNAFDKTFMELYVKNIVNPLINSGVDFLWNDYKKDVSTILSLNYYNIESFGDKLGMRPLTLARNPLVAPHKYPVHYSGETLVSWDTLSYLPYFNSLACNMGISWWSHDVGGFKDGVEDSELYLRYVEFSCFNPIFRFASIRGKYYKREPWAWDIKTFTIAREYCFLRQRLIPYIYTEAYNYSKNGQPLIQPIYYRYPEIIDEPDYKDEYYFGRELFVAPITKPKDALMDRSIERIFLPDGVWYDFKTGKKFMGGKKYVAFYKDEEYPIFAASGSIIPLAILGANKNDTGVPKSLEINVFPGRSNVYKLYEDDGMTLLYKEGYYTVTAIEYNYLENNYTLIINPIEGKTSVIPSKRNYRVRFRNTRNADEVEVFVNGEKTDLSYKTYVLENDFLVEIEDAPTTKQLTINCRGKDIEIDAVRIINEDINSIINDLKIPTKLKEEIADVIFSNKDIRLKRIELKKIKNLDKRFVRMFLKLLEYISKI